MFEILAYNFPWLENGDFFMVKHQKRSREVGSIHVIENKDLSCEEWRIIEGFSVGHFCGLICDFEH